MGQMNLTNTVQTEASETGPTNGLVNHGQPCSISLMAFFGFQTQPTYRLNSKEITIRHNVPKTWSMIP